MAKKNDWTESVSLRPRHQRSADVASVAEDILGVRPEIDRSVEIPLDLIDLSPYQPRIDFSGLHDLVESIKSTGGVVQPIIVRPQGNRFELIAGERRLRASKEAGYATIKAVVRSVDDKTAMRATLAENLARKDLSDYEKSRSMQHLYELEGDLTVRQTAAFLRVSHEQARRLMVFQKLPESIKQVLNEYPNAITVTIVDAIYEACNDGREGLALEAVQLAASGILKGAKVVAHLNPAKLGKATATTVVLNGESIGDLEIKGKKITLTLTGNVDKELVLSMIKGLFDSSVT